MHARGAVWRGAAGAEGAEARAKRNIHLQIRAKGGMYYAINYCPLLGTGSICIGFFGMQVIRGGWRRMTSLPELSVWRGLVRWKKKERARFPNSGRQPGVSAIQPYIISLLFMFSFFLAPRFSCYFSVSGNSAARDSTPSAFLCSLGG